LYELNGVNKTILIIPDTHAPYHHKDTVSFLTAIQKQFRPDIVIHLGDEADKHAMSFHDSDPNLDSPGRELEEARIFLQDLYGLFPKMILLDSNHGSLIYRRAYSSGIPREYIRPLYEVYGTPGWTWYEDLIIKTSIGDVFLCHGKTQSYGRLCKEVGCSAIQGHFHSKFEVTWHKSARTERFNIFSGCLIDRKSLAFAYGKNHLPKAILGVTLLNGEGMPWLVKMGLTKSHRWTKKL